MYKRQIMNIEIKNLKKFLILKIIEINMKLFLMNATLVMRSLLIMLLSTQLMVIILETEEEPFH